MGILVDLRHWKREHEDEVEAKAQRRDREVRRGLDPLWPGAHEIVKASISRLAPDEEAVYDALVTVIDDIDGYLEPDEDPTERRRESEGVRDCADVHRSVRTR